MRTTSVKTYIQYSEQGMVNTFIYCGNKLQALNKFREISNGIRPTVIREAMQDCDYKQGAMEVKVGTIDGIYLTYVNNSRH